MLRLGLAVELEKRRCSGGELMDGKRGTFS